MTTKKQINQTISRGLKEMRKFKGSKPQYILPLQQAGNKMYKAYVQLLEFITKKRIRTKDGVEMITYELNNKLLERVYIKVRYLHSFFYSGEGGRHLKEQIVSAAKEIKQVMRQY